MKTVTFPISSTDFIDQLVKREGNVVLTRRTSKNSGKTVCFDIQIIRKYRKTRTFHTATVYEGDEYLPSNSEWGSHGWSYPNPELAEKKFQEIVEKQTQKEK